MRDELDTFLRSLPEFDQISAKHTDFITYLGYFLAEVLDERVIEPKRLRDCYDAAAMGAPRNIPDVIRKSRSFVRTKGGYLLQRSVKDRIRKLVGPQGTGPSGRDVGPSTPGDTSGRVRNVLVVHGRDEVIRESLFQFCRCLRLNPIEWTHAVRLTGRGSPYVGQILDRAFESAQAVVVLLTPDDQVSLREDLVDTENEAGWQPRPNVLLEAGMALARDEARTILVQVGKLRRISDLEGRHVVHLGDDPKSRNELAQRLKTAGCTADTSGSDWLTVGSFELNVHDSGQPRRARRAKR